MSTPKANINPYAPCFYPPPPPPAPPKPLSPESSPAQAYARQAVEAAFGQQMARLMAQALTDRAPEEHHQWLEAARHLLDQRHAALLWQHMAFCGDEAQIQALVSMQFFTLKARTP